MKKVAVIHPDLCIGGAERLMIDLTHAVMKYNYETTVWTSHYNPKNAFPDTNDLTIKVHGSIIPRGIRGFGHVFFALLANFYLTICAIISGADVYIIDQIAAFIPLIKLFRKNAKIVFYCHHPDLVQGSHASILRKLYRLPFDWIEIFGTKRADLIYVNSKYTAEVTEKYLGIKNTKVLYPCVDVSQKIKRYPSVTPLYVSLNRYEKKKDHALAVRALSEIIGELPEAKLVIAGGYNSAVRDNVDDYAALEKLRDELGLGDKVELLKSISDAKKLELLSTATALLYTPQNEHFGIVPLEAQVIGTPVIACNSGGPRETCAVDGCFLCDPAPGNFASAMIESFTKPANPAVLIENAKKFGFEEFSKIARADVAALLEEPKL